MTETVKDCHYPWTWMMVTADGGVTPCCFASGALGNLNEATAEAIWNGTIATELRSYIKADRIHPVCESAPCKFVQNMQGNRTETRLDRCEDFDERWYLANNPDVGLAIEGGRFESGWQHYAQHGWQEGRPARKVKK